MQLVQVPVDALKHRRFRIHDAQTILAVGVPSDRIHPRPKMMVPSRALALTVLVRPRCGTPRSDEYGRRAMRHVGRQDVWWWVAGDSRSKQHTSAPTVRRVAEEGRVSAHLAFVEVHHIRLSQAYCSLLATLPKALFEVQNTISPNPMRELVQHHQVEATDAGRIECLAEWRDAARPHATVSQRRQPKSSVVESKSKSQAVTEQGRSVADSCALERFHARTHVRAWHDGSVPGKRCQ